MALTRFARVLKNEPIEFWCIGEILVHWGNSGALGEFLANRANAIRPNEIFRSRSQLK